MDVRQSEDTAVGLLHPRDVASIENEPGGSTQRRYNDLVKAWRRRNRRLFVVLGALCGAVLAASVVVAWMWPSQRWTAGFLGGVALTFFLISRLSPPGWIENWQQGAWGEMATGKVLGPLEKEGWVVLHDLPAERGNVDHIVIGPGGVFLLDSKRLGGSVNVESDGVTVRRFGDPDLTYRHPGGGHLLGLARETHDRVRQETRISQWVTPVMVLWSDFPQRIAEQQHCHYVHGDELANWLRTQQTTIAANRVGQVASAVRSSWTNATASS
jgi:hypothetical protein